jgi:uncharacterized membrane protein
VKTASASVGGGRRIALLDVVRGIAIVAMVIYHAAFDLRMQGLIAVDVENSFGWTLLARLTAGTFLLVVGISLVLAIRRGFNWQPYLKRLLWIAAGAGLVTISTWWFDPATYVRFGILHQIAFASIVALPLALFVPSPVIALVAVAIFTARWMLAGEAFNEWPWWLTGLAASNPSMVDFVPPFPWLGVVLVGVLAGRVVSRHQEALASWKADGRLAALLGLAGRWSLVIYLVHQPLLVGIFAAWAAVFPPGEGIARANFMGACELSCQTEPNGGSCQAFCGCIFESLYGTPLFERSSFEEMSSAERQQFDGILNACTPVDAQRY